MAKDVKFKSLFEYYGFTKSDEKKYPVISEILKELTPERIEKEIKEVQKVELPKEIKKWVKEYEKVGDRNPFIWKWVYYSAQMITFPTVLKSYQAHVWKIKFLLFMFDTLIDDVADKTKNKKFLIEILNAVSKKNFSRNNLTKKNLKYILFTKKIWKKINQEIKKLPKYHEFYEIFIFDIEQLYNTMRYSKLINRKPYIANITEFWNYLSHNMLAMACCSVDLMSSPTFKIEKIGKTREIFWYAQKMARIGNWVSTWEREVYEEDYTSGIFAYAFKENIISYSGLKHKNKIDIINKIKKEKIEHKFLIKWEENYQLLALSFQTPQEFLNGLKKFIILHLTSRGYK